MAFTAADVVLAETQIQAWIAEGSWRVRVIQFSDGQSATLDTMDAAIKFLAWLKGQVAAAAAATAGTNPHVRWATVDKGFD